MQREIGNKVFLGQTVSPFDDIGNSSAIDRTASNYTDAKEKVGKIRELISTGKYDADIAKYIPGILEMKFQGMLEDIDTREKVGHSSYKEMEEVDFQISLTYNHYVNPNRIHRCFPMKIKKSTNEANNIDGDLITVNNFFAHLIKEISITKYGSDIELIPTFSPYEIYQYSHAMMKHLPKDSLKKLEKTMLYSNMPVYLNKTSIGRRVHNGSGSTTNAGKTNDAKDLNIDDRITKFQDQLKDEYVYRIPLRYFTDLGKINFPRKIDFRIKCHLETEMKRLFESRKFLPQQLQFLPLTRKQYLQRHLSSNMNKFYLIKILDNT